MACPDCPSTATTRREGRTALGYERFRCRARRRRFNERTGTLWGTDIPSAGARASGAGSPRSNTARQAVRCQRTTVSGCTTT